MPTPARKHTNKQPRQRRAHQTVERILAATATIIEQEGVDAVTTNLIAERASVNIASLYQYFSNKETVINALLEAYFQEISRALNDVLMTQVDMPIEQSTRLWCQAALAYFRERPALLAVMLRLRHQAPTLDAAKLLEYRLREAMRRFLMGKREELKVPDLDLAIEVAFLSCSAVLSRHLLDPMPYHKDEDVIDELVRLMTGYFKGA